MKLSSTLPMQPSLASGPTTLSPAPSASSAASASTPAAPVASPAPPPGQLADLAAVPLTRLLGAVPELVAIQGRVLGELANRQREGMERTARYLDRVRAGGPEYEDARRRKEALRSMLAGHRPGSTTLFDLAKFAVEVDLSVPEPLPWFLPEDVPLWLIECEAWGWLVVPMEPERLAAVLADRLELWGRMAGHEASARPTGRTARVPDDHAKSGWWAWAAEQEGRLLVPA